MANRLQFPSRMHSENSVEHSGEGEGCDQNFWLEQKFFENNRSKQYFLIETVVSPLLQYLVKCPTL